MATSGPWCRAAIPGSCRAGYYLDWTKTTECLNIFRSKKGLSAPRVRGLLVEWTHMAYLALEDERRVKEKAGDASLFELAFRRTGALVSTNNDDVDDGIQPEGMEAAMQNSKDTYYQDHKITNFRQLLQCSDGKCGHVEPCSPPPGVPNETIRNDNATVRKRFRELEFSDDVRLMLIVKCLKAGMRWAGSSLVTFLSEGVSGLRIFLSACSDDGKLLHDVDLYREHSKIKKIGVRFLTKKWLLTSTEKCRGVDKFELEYKASQSRLAIDQVNQFKTTLSPSTDIWGNLCAAFNTQTDSFQIEKFAPKKGPKLEVTINNALRVGKEVWCGLLRPATCRNVYVQRSWQVCCKRFLL